MNDDVTPERWSRMKALFAAAAEAPASERSELLAREARGDSALIAEVQSLLAAHDEPGEFLDSSPAELKAQAFAVADDDGRVGERIGAYRIVGVLGAGGMGQVFKAVRDDDQYRAEVAIKLMRADVRDMLAEQRFKTERQILAGLDHRNIARLLDGGRTGGGSPYVVMELVNGEPIDRFSDSRGLNVRDRVQLFLQVCAAVGYAHQHLIIHRDLKPNNILVTGDGSVKLLDFGIAKLLDVGAGAGATGDETATQWRVMTLDYASPEQVSGGAVTTVSDVYSLGVVLYRLLTGQSPYGPRTNDAQRVAEILSDTAPTRPSLVRTNDRQRQRGIDADLDNILLMALRKEPQERYPSVEQFAGDLRNYLAGMPVKARGNSLRYRAGKFVRRRKVEIAAAVLMVCALLGALAFSIREARIAERERQVAQQHFDSVRKLANTMLLQLHDELERDSGSLKAREMMVRTSLEYLDSLYQQSGSDRRLQEELATAYIKVAAILGKDASGANRGDYRGALRSYERAIALLTPLLSAEPANHRVGWALGTAYVQQAELLMVVHGPKYAREAAHKGVALMEFFAPAMADELQRMRQLSSGYATQGQILGFMGLTTEAMDSFDKLLTVAEAFWHSHPEDQRALRALSWAYNMASLTDDTRLSTSKSYERNVALLKKSLWADEELMKLQPNAADNLQRLSASRFNLGNYAYARGRYGEALVLYELAIPVVRDEARNAEDANAQYRLALYETKLAQSLLKLQKIEEAQGLLLRCAKVLETLLERDGSLRTEYAVGLNAVRLGELYAHLAGNPRLSHEKQSELWRQARDTLQRGVTSLQKVTANAKLQAIDMEVVDDGVESLARAEGELAKLQGRVPTK